MRGFLLVALVALLVLAMVPAAGAADDNAATVDRYQCGFYTEDYQGSGYCKRVITKDGRFNLTGNGWLWDTVTPPDKALRFEIEGPCRIVVTPTGRWNMTCHGVYS